MRDYFPIRDSKRLQCAESAFKRRNSTALSRLSIFFNMQTNKNQNYIINQSNSNSIRW